MKFHLLVYIIVDLVIYSLCQSTDLPPQEAMATSTTTTTSPGLLLTTADTISFIYPKEMNYEKDYMHVVLKIVNKTRYRIEDSVYDNKTWSIYFILSTSDSTSSSSSSNNSATGGSGGSSLIRLKQQHRRLKQPSLAATQHQMPQLEDFNYELAPNWHLTHIYSNRTARLLSLDLNAAKRKLYWFEFDRATRRWSLGLLRLFNPMARSSVTYHALSAPFSTDGYSYLAVASDSVVFISNNQSLILCHLDNETCFDYFRPTIVPQNTALFDDEYYDDIDHTPMTMQQQQQQQQQHQTSEDEEHQQKFGKIMGIRYDAQENALYLNDYLSDKIEKLKFVQIDSSGGRKDDLDKEANQFRMSSLEAVLKSEYLSTSLSHIALNPIMSVEFEGYIYWADYEEGVRTSLLKSTCFRSVYKVREPLSLRLVFITSTIPGNWLRPNGLIDEQQSPTGLKSLSGYKFKYPPDYLSYYFYNGYLSSSNATSSLLGHESSPKRFDSAALNRSSFRRISNFFVFCLQIVLLFYSIYF